MHTASAPVAASAPTPAESATVTNGSEVASKAKPEAGSRVQVALLLALSLPAQRPGGRQPVPTIQGDGAYVGSDDARRGADVLHFAPPGHARANPALLAVVVVQAEAVRAGRRRALRLAVVDRVKQAIAAEVAFQPCAE